MVDYAISAIDRNDEAKGLTGISSGNDVCNFEDIRSRGKSSAWNAIDGTHNSFRIIEAASPADSQLQTIAAPWNQVASHAVERLDHIQRDWKRAEQKLFSLEETSPHADITTQEGLNDNRAMLLNLLRVSYTMLNSQLRLSLVSSVAGTFKTSIATLYRQQG